MNESVMRFVERNNAKVIIFDIDGTLKDLCVEHTNAVKNTLQCFGVNKFKRKIVLTLNRLAMYLVKLGIITTNPSKQNFLVKIYALLCGIKIVDFYEEYFENYTKEFCLFEGVCDLLDALSGEKEVYFATINKQNYNLEACGIMQERIDYTDGAFKVATYNRIVKKLGVDKSEVVIVGDNLVDDLFSAKQLGIKCLLINRYCNRLKSVICRLVNSKYLK